MGSFPRDKMKNKEYNTIEKVLVVEEARVLGENHRL
jgi:hypothetical protein